MERKKFLEMMGLGAATIFVGACMGGCKKSDSGANVTGPTGVDFTLDLSLPANANLLSNGGYLYSNGIILAKTIAGAYIAVSQSCTHEGVTVQYQGTQQQFYCPSHGATFSNTGAVKGGPVSRGLTQYNTALTGTQLRVYS